MPSLRLKPTVSLRVVGAGGARILWALAKLAQDQALDLTVSCANEGHPADDPHTHGNAVDVSTMGWTPAQIVARLLWLRNDLGHPFTVLYETPTAPTDASLQPLAFVNAGATAPHLHCQPTKGTVYAAPPDGIVAPIPHASVAPTPVAVVASAAPTV